MERGLVIVGGSDAGIMAGLWAREVAPELPVTLLVRDTYPNFSICGIPFYVSGETPEWSCWLTGPSPTCKPSGFACCSITTSSRSIRRPAR